MLVQGFDVMGQLPVEHPTHLYQASPRRAPIPAAMTIFMVTTYKIISTI